MCPLSPFRKLENKKVEANQQITTMHAHRIKFRTTLRKRIISAESMTMILLSFFSSLSLVRFQKIK